MIDCAVTAQSPASAQRTVIRCFIAEGLGSLSSNMLTLGIFFYLQNRFGWSLGQNLLLAAGQGVVYTAGSLLASRASAAFGRRRCLVVCFGCMAGVLMIGLTGHLTQSAPLLVIALLATNILAALNWPLLESLVSEDADPRTLSRRLGIYNIVWSGTGALIIAVNGLIIEYWPVGQFALPASFCAGASLILLPTLRYAPARADDVVAPPHLAPPADLLHSRRLAMWLSRMALPSTYIVIFALGAMAPSLHVLQDFSTPIKTALTSIWMLVRVLAFLLLMATVAWHTRPRLLLLATAAVLVGFLGTVTPPDGSLPIALACMVLGQVVLGIGLGVVYQGSLYFGMVLSDGSTEHGGYHEALIGLGGAMGPAVAAVIQHIRPGDVAASSMAVGALVGLTLAAACTISITLRGRRSE